MRNGAYVRQKFEEATKSHGLEKWSVQFIVQVITTQPIYVQYLPPLTMVHNTDTT